MNLYYSLTLRYLKQNKKRTIVTIIGIILSTSLICGIGNMVESFIDYQIRETIADKGDYHAMFHNVKKYNLNIITNSAGLCKSFIADSLGYSKLNNEKKNLVEVKEYDKSAFESYKVKLKEGKLPKNNNEIVLSESAIPLINKKVGDNITLDIGKRISADGKNLENSLENPIVWDHETIVNKKSKDFKIVGIMNKPKNDIGDDVVSSITYLDVNSKSKNDILKVGVSANKPKEIYKISESIARNLGLKKEVINSNSLDEKNNDNGVHYKNLSFNESLLRLKGASVYVNTNKATNLTIFIVIALVVICTIATVYNSFSISTSERRKQFGILNSIGATKNQVMKSVFIEAIIVGLIGIPVGLIIGTFAIDLVLKLIQVLFNNSQIASMNLRLVYNPYVIVLSALIVLFTIFVSAIFPAIKSAKTSPLECIRNSSNLKLGKVKNSKLIKLLFKTEGVLAYKNLRRNKKKFRITLFSLTISVVIFISFSGFLTLFEKANEINTGKITYDIRVWKSGIQEKNNIIEDLNEIKGIKKTTVTNDYGVGINVNENNINKKYKKIIDDSFSKKNKNNEVVYDFIMEQNGFHFISDKDIKTIKLKDGNFDKETAIKENGIILRNKSYYKEAGKAYDISLTNYKVGDTIDAYKMYRDKKDKEIIEPIKLKVLATTEDLPIGNNYSSYMGIDFITYNEVGTKLGYETNDSNIYIYSDKKENTRKAVNDIGKKYAYDVYDEVENALKTEQSIKIIKTFVYGFIFIISLVSIINIVNTISTNINLRKREFAIIKSIGTTPGGFNRIIYFESLLYGVLALMYGVPIAIGIDVLMNKTIGAVVELGMILPWDAVLVCVLGTFAVTFIASYIPMKKLNKESIIENIRQESI
ncbi:ABC transporter permease [Paraclostridium ghonii]|uniref:ABC transport system permease protein n=1 Tax=Paraclostridium ghonii TaxID=29358 RepID=A0ABU0N169_9FIRM|nr:ABC transporter permease [Paeniclostridium ghonii]MDQ0556908.1 putative ABC transport system permease protein [Paeniclostridium ghonii]